jgi:amino acid transporter
LIIFLAYEGFELIANTAADIENPQRNLPRAYIWSVVSVIVLYVVVAVVAVGNLTPEQVIKAKDYALAVAAEPFF